MSKVYEYADKLAMKRYGKDYDELTAKQKKEINKLFDRLIKGCKKVTLRKTRRDGVKQRYHITNESKRMIYRVRGFYKGTRREAWVTTVWRRTKEEAEQDKRLFTRPEDWKNVQVISMKYDDFLRRYQRIPKF